MSFLKRLAAVELVAQIALATCAILFALIFVLVGKWGSASDNTVAETAAASVGLALIVYVSGLISVALVGAPIYAILEAKRLMNTLTAVIVGALPGVVLLLASWVSSLSMVSAIRLNVSPDYALIYIVLGITVGVMTHLLRTWRKGDAA